MTRAKLRRELDRLKKANGDREAPSDHGINFATAAWHLVDWVWRHIGDAYPLKIKIAKENGVGVPELKIEHLQRYLCSLCPNLVYRQAIATASKHVACDSKLLGLGNYQTQIGSAFSQSATMSFSLGSDWTLKIVDGDQRLPAIPVFEVMLEFWTHFIHTNQIDWPQPTPSEIEEAERQLRRDS